MLGLLPSINRNSDTRNYTIRLPHDDHSQTDYSSETMWFLTKVT